MSTGGAGGSSGGYPECTTSKECQLIADCCNCLSMPIGSAAPFCSAGECFASNCEVRSVGASDVACIAGRCTFSRTCNTAGVTCTIPIPVCPAGQANLIVGTCYSGGCVPVEDCSDVGSCDVCKAGGLSCVTFQTRPPSYHCVSTPPQCVANPTCACMGLCNGVMSCLAPDSTTLTCQCPRLTRLFGRAIDQPIATIAPAKAKELYLGLTGAVDSRMNTLAEAKTFFQFAKARGTPVHPLEGVKGEGRRHYGKAKLSRDEARKFLAKCLELASSGREKQRVAAVAAAMPLVFGLRASEVTERQVRDLDDQGAILRVTRAKSRAGIRSLQVPDWFKPHLQALAANKQPNDLLVGHERTWLHRHVGQICEAAGVLKVPTHGLRGTHSDLALVAASTPLAVSQALGHESASTTFKHYVDANLAEQNDHQRATAALAPN